jgi:hypothetical protein
VTLSANRRVLRKIYELRRQLPSSAELPYQLWEGDAGGGSAVMIKAWPFLSSEPGEIEQTLWYRELRTLYRLASTPEAERRLVTLIDAQVDKDAGAYLIALRVPGFTRLDEVLERRSAYMWLNTTEPARRARLWRGALTLIEGLSHVHRFRSLHRAVSAESIFLDPQQGPESFRLSGFEWSTRLGSSLAPVAGFRSFLAQANASLNVDWHDLGIVLARLFAVNAPPPVSPQDHAAFNRVLHEHPRLTADEKSLIQTLVGANGHGPMDRSDLERVCRDVIESLERPSGLRESDRLGIVVSLRTRSGPSQLAVRVVDTDPSLNASEEESIRRWIEDDLADTEIVTVGDPGNEMYFLKGRRLPYRLYQYDLGARDGRQALTWNVGFLAKTEYIDERYGSSKLIPFRGIVKVYTANTADRNYDQIVSRTRSWQSLLPPARSVEAGGNKQLDFLKQFLAVTNQIEEGIRETEVYPVEVVSCEVDEWGTHERLTVREAERSTKLPMAARAQPMLRYLSEEDAGEGRAQVYVGPESQLQIRRRVEKEEYWVIEDLPSEGGQNEKDVVVLRRPLQSPFQKQGVLFLRTSSMFGQVELLNRRDDAIDLLSTHQFLQRSIVLPDTVFMDTGMDTLPLPFPPVTQFDLTKSNAVRLIWRTRPIFCLQGPPGTGKTTLIGQLLRQVYEEDPSVQVLLSAQAHAAVDHLRDEVSKFITDRRKQEASWIEPLAVRLRKAKPGETGGGDDSASPATVAKSVLSRCLTALENRESVGIHLQEWLSYVRKQLAGVSAEDPKAKEDDDAPAEFDFEWLVRRSANFVYCSSTAKDLLALARSHQTFDWSIIEEAGKAHGFDLVLPLQTGHRWLLIGDQKQLFPYRHEDFSHGLDRLDPILAPNAELRRFWERLTTAERSEFVDASQRWLYFFRQLFATTEARPERPLVEMLRLQHRMHPSIGDLISHAFYEDRLKNGTKDEDTLRPLPKVVHRFVQPEYVLGRAIVWIDVPTLDLTKGKHEGYSVNHAEVAAVQRTLAVLQVQEGNQESVVVLTPYRRQVALLRKALNSTKAPAWAKAPEGAKQTLRDTVAVFTVDSFQGHQASTVLISLVRNNQEKFTDRALGFLRFFERVNVMMSRAERLLVLVGSWDFFFAHLSQHSDESGQVYSELRRLVEWLDRAFATGIAFRHDVSDLSK